MISTKTLVNGRYGQVAGFLIVSLTMVEMFTIPHGYFVLGAIVSTSTMTCVALLLKVSKSQFRWSAWRIGTGIAMAGLLYLVFAAGNYAIKNYSMTGIHPSNEGSIYGLFAGVPAPLTIGFFVLDAIGFETYFRGNLQQRIFSPRIGVGSVFLVAMIDALIHFSSLNPLFPATTFVADMIWGLNYYLTKDLNSTIACHFLWDMLVFVVFPIH
ncbi:MAG: CPBP family glutamic-type intramembrane protease [Nitrososphaerales archaeon]